MHVLEALSFPSKALSYKASKKIELKVQVALSGLEHVYISERETRAMCVCSQEFETATGRNLESITCWTLFVPLFF